MLETMAALVATGASLVGLAKGATDTAQGIKDLVEKPDVDTAAAKNLVSDLLDRLIKLQAEQIAMQGAILQLREEQRRIDKFEAEAVRYILTRTEQNSLVYELDPSQANGQPTHCICATCYEKQIKSILQPSARNTLTCAQCGGTFYKPDGSDIGILIGKVRRPDFDGFI
jgi:polyhydroxyalkanoate synthesis regulator phasin